jgi:hypothetical protein
MARDRAKERAEHNGYVGFVACSHGAGRVLKVGLSSKRERIRIACPIEGCNSPTHETAAAMPRARSRGEHVDAVLRDDPPAEPAKPPPSPTAVKISDAAILAAVPAEWTPAIEVAKAAGFKGNTASMQVVGRVERINAAADGEPVEIDKPGAPKPTLLRRREVTS